MNNDNKLIMTNTFIIHVLTIASLTIYCKSGKTKTTINADIESDDRLCSCNKADNSLADRPGLLCARVGVQANAAAADNTSLSPLCEPPSLPLSPLRASLSLLRAESHASDLSLSDYPTRTGPANTPIPCPVVVITSTPAQP